MKEGGGAGRGIREGCKPEVREERGREGGEREEHRQGGGQGFWVGEKGWWESERD